MPHYRNQANYRDPVQFVGISSCDNEEAPDSGTIDTSDNTRISKLKNLMQHDKETQDFSKNLVIAAAEHIKDTMSQKDLACQRQGQPGDPYYYSPIWNFCLVIVNSSTNQLYAYTYPKCAARKGANNVAPSLAKP